MKFENANVLITGGASGIGKIMGRMALQKGAKCFIIWDINLAGIEATRKELSKYGKVKGYVVNVSDNDVVTAAYKKMVEDCGRIDILINCAGIVTGNKTFDKQTPDEIVRTMNINAVAPMFVTLAALPDMIKRNSGHICNITSAGGMLANPKILYYYVTISQSKYEREMNSAGKSTESAAEGITFSGKQTAAGSLSGEAHTRCEGRRCKTAVYAAANLSGKRTGHTLNRVSVLLCLPGFSERGSP